MSISNPKMISLAKDLLTTLEMIFTLRILWYGTKIFLPLETIIMEEKHKTMKLELLTVEACFAYIAGKKNTNENKNANILANV